MKVWIVRSYVDAYDNPKGEVRGIFESEERAKIEASKKQEGRWCRITYKTDCSDIDIIVVELNKVYLPVRCTQTGHEDECPI